MSISYAGVGSRKTPVEVVSVMAKLGSELASKGYRLRSGGAEGADTAFEYGCNRANGESEIYLPWPGFNGHDSTLHTPTKGAFTVIKKTLDPAHLARLSEGALKLHARNVHQVLGQDLKTPVSFLVCWTEGGKVEGGTATAIKIAKSNGIPVFNLGVGPFVLDDLNEFVATSVVGG